MCSYLFDYWSDSGTKISLTPWHRVTLLFKQCQCRRIGTLPYSVLQNTKFSCPTIFLFSEIRQNIYNFSKFRQEDRPIFVSRVSFSSRLCFVLLCPCLILWLLLCLMQLIHSNNFPLFLHSKPTSEILTLCNDYSHCK